MARNKFWIGSRTSWRKSLESRSWSRPPQSTPSTIPGLELHLRKQTVKWQGQPLHLTHLEFFTLAYLARHPGWIFTQEQIYEAVWHEFPEDCGAAVVNIISQLRRKMGPGNPIRTVPHSGYKFELPSAD